ncbi:histidine kinase dimerization/phospho-acceptor domain-containing protein [Asticcacaulis excentricus]|uniref:histidine kinase n=1 Tax=Asticcacaulis excentricus (strain ATCC 15261 / DSM 4724 / KCTC 12464 / NCIMB 9791 / VKM B-1370 / CB 48) TaxID=573065 RepID=E8RN76_ASTEC|nr:histidine kinase dimerization/phospho-acceptor domain-containing protein [Asticcacaulis excentricus]ADU13975.1 histidine kinase [Asticcacaulis excentricus CB 48]
MAAQPRKRIFLPLVLGLLVLIALALMAPGAQWLVWVAVGVLAVSLFMTYSELQRLKNAVVPDALPVPERTRVQPEGPSFQEVLRAIPDPVMIVSGIEPNDIAGRWIVFANKAAVEAFGIAKEGGLLVSSLRYPEVLEAVDEALFGNMERDTVFETSGAQDKFWRAWTSPLPVAEGGLRRLALLVIRDETDIRRIERMRADFLANASHELRTPLASLTGFIETLRGHAKDDIKARDKFLNIMASQADRMGRLIQDLLSLSRIEMNEHVPPSGEADVSLCARDVMDSLSILAQEKGVGLSLKAPPPGEYSLTADRDQVLQVVQNLSDNALKYAPAGSTIEIEVFNDCTLEEAFGARDPSAAKLVLLRPDQRGSWYTVVRVTDRGPGIRREFLPRLAERFYRVEGQKSGDRLGTGLGLAIVKHIINRHRGALGVESVAKPSSLDDKDLLPYGGLDVAPTGPVETYTSFTACFPQPGRYKESAAIGFVNAR